MRSDICYRLVVQCFCYGLFLSIVNFLRLLFRLLCNLMSTFLIPEQLKRVDGIIRHQMCERMKVWNRLWHESGTDDDKSEVSVHV